MAVRGRETVRSWSAFSALVNRSLTALTRQTSGAYRVVVVCDQLPEGALRHAKIDYVHLPRRGSEVPSWGEAEADKSARLALGAHYCEDFEPTHMMSVDSDDLVSRDLAAFVAAAPDATGWFLDQGYFWPHGSRIAHRRTHGFNQVCGSSLIARRDLFGQIFQDSPLAFEQAPMPADGQWFDHRLRSLGATAPLTALPFPGAVYCVFHGSNVRADSILAERAAAAGGHLRLFGLQARMTRPRWVTAGFELEFGLRS